MFTFLQSFDKSSMTSTLPRYLFLFLLVAERIWYTLVNIGIIVAKGRKGSASRRKYRYAIWHIMGLSVIESQTALPEVHQHFIFD